MTEDQGTDQSKRIGDYEVLGVLGAGGMGKVFKVRNVISDRVEAMKILLPDLEGRQELAERFLREIKLLASLDHPNIAQLRTALTLSNRLVMVMEYVEGTTLAARLEQGPIPPGEAIGYVTQVLNALAYAHAKSVIHRDIKPANMMLTPNGTIKLMDFGIARAKGDASMTVTGTTLGSLFYMSPEQVKGGTVDPRSDLYSLGVSLYEMVTGQLPFKAGSDYSIMTAQLQERPKPPSEVLPGLPPQLNGIILHSMAKEPTERFQSADEFRQALESIRQSIPASVPVAAAFAPVAMPAPSGTAVASTPTAATGAFAPVAMPSSSATSMPLPPVPAQPQPVPSVMDLSPRPGKGRGLYMALGAAVVLVVLVLAGISLPRLLKTRAAERQLKSADTPPAAQDQNSTQNSSQTPPADASSANPNTPAGSSAPDSTKPADGSTPPPADAGTTPPSGTTDASASSGTAASGSSASTATSAPPKAKGKGKKGKSGGSSTADQGSSTASTGGNTDSGNGTADAGKESVQAVEQDVDETSSRATAATQSLDTMKRSLSAQGLNLRGDIVSAQELMNSNLERARQALANNDTKGARKYLDMAQAQQNKIEKFLGH
jgi:serine/threonine-protein kinase